jgi:hypothetical protein
MEPSCSTWSLDVGEPLAGTAAAETEFWIVLEHAGPWGPKGADDSGLPAELVSHLSQFTKEEKRARVQLIRRPERAGSEAFVYLARSTPGNSRLLAATFARLEQLCAVDLTAWAGGAVPAGFAQVSDPLYLVCVHGRRDRCCALRGMPVFSALAALEPGVAGPVEARASAPKQNPDGARRPAVFQTTHLGGHRFAATLVVLPEGICYGRLEASEAEALRTAHAAGRFHALARVRGRSAYEAAAQTAELRLLADLGETELAALALLGVVTDAASGEAEVRFRHQASGREHSVRVVKQALAASAQSCGATPRPSEALIALTSVR